MNLKQLTNQKYDLAFIVAMEDESRAIYLQSTQGEEVPYEQAEKILIGNARFLPIDLETNVRGINVTLKCLLCESKIGKVHSASAATTVLNLFNVGMIINYGLCGAVDAQPKGTVIIASSVSYGDVDLRDFDYQYGQVPGSRVSYTMPPQFTQKIYDEWQPTFMNLQRGRIVSLDRFVGNRELKERIVDLVALSQHEENNEDAILGIDMEAAAIAHVCYNYKKTLFIFKEVSDNADENAAADFDAAAYDEQNPCTNVVSLIMSVLPEFYVGLQAKRHREAMLKASQQ